MTTSKHERCYGKMFPSILCLKSDKPISGKAFGYRLERAGGTFVSQREATVQMDQWDDCVDCAEFEHCYKLSMARLALETAVAGG